MPIHRQAVRKRVDLTVAAEQQPCGVQVVEIVDLVLFKRQISHKKGDNNMYPIITKKGITNGAKTRGAPSLL